MLIGDLAKRSGTPRDTIRYYTQLGLLKPVVSANGTNNYLRFCEQDVERLSLIKQAQHMGFTLRQIGEQLEQYLSNELTRDQQLATVQAQLAQVNERIHELERIRDYFTAKLAAIESGQPVPMPPTAAKP